MWSVVIPSVRFIDHEPWVAMAQAKAERTRATSTAAWCCGCVG